MNKGISKKKIDIDDDYQEDKMRLLSKQNLKKTVQLHRHVIYRDSNYIPFNDTRIIGIIFY